MAPESISKPDPKGPPKTCPECQGRGWVDNRCLTKDQAHRCPVCDGRGTDTIGRDCYACRGTGLLDARQENKNPCPLCGGAGIYPVPESMTAREFAYNPGQK